MTEKFSKRANSNPSLIDVEYVNFRSYSRSDDEEIVYRHIIDLEEDDIERCVTVAN